MPPKKPPKPTPAWVARTAAPAKPIVPKVTVLNKLTSSEWKGIVATVDERIEWSQFQTLVTKNFSSWERRWNKNRRPQRDDDASSAAAAAAQAEAIARCAPEYPGTAGQPCESDSYADLCGL
jgi:hypothetical protein